MKNAFHHLTGWEAAVMGAAFVLSGCATSHQARELATETAAVVQALDVALAHNAEVAKKQSDDVSGRLSTLLRDTAEGQADLQARIDASPMNADFMELRRFADTEEAGRQEKLRAADATVKAAAASQQAWKAPSASLREVSDILTVLGREESARDRLRATASFIKEVTDRIKKDNAAAAKAKE